MERPKWGTPGEQDNLLFDGSKTKLFCERKCERGECGALRESR
jgi:hypothetical protein